MAPRKKASAPSEFKIRFEGNLQVLQFRKRPDSIKDFRSWLSSSLGKEVMGVLYAAIPAGYPMRGQAVTDTQASIELGRIQGYLDCLLLFKSLSVYPDEPPPQLESSYGALNFIKEHDLPHPDDNPPE